MKAQRISAQIVKQRMKKGDYFIFIDARRPEAWASSDIKLPHARRIPAGEIEQRLHEIPSGLPIITYCTCPEEASSASAAEKINQHGFKEVYALTGGLDAWRAAGNRVEKKEAGAENSGHGIF